MRQRRGAAPAAWALTSARLLPTVSGVMKKLFPESRSVTAAGSATVIRPTPGSTRFFSASAPVAPAVTSRTLAAFNLAWSEGEPPREPAERAETAE